MIGALVAILSLNLTASLVQDYGQVAATLPIAGATATTPIAISSPGHNVPLGRVLHAIVSGVRGMTEANGLWVLTPVDQNTFTLSTFTAQGVSVQSIGTNAYTGGGVASLAFPDGSILLGRRNLATSTAVTTPRIVFVPTAGRAWDFESYGGVGAPATAPPNRGSLEAQAEKLSPQIATEFATFDVYVTGAANPPSPDFGDFDATQSVVHALYAVMWNACGPRAKVLRASWPSQSKDSGTVTQRGAQWCGIVELPQPVFPASARFVPPGTSFTFTIEPINPLVPDDVTNLVVS